MCRLMNLTIRDESDDEREGEGKIDQEEEEEVLTLSGSSISSYSKYSSNLLIQSINSSGLRFPKNVRTLNLGLFPILVMA